MTEVINKFLKIASAVGLLFGAIVAAHDAQRGIFLALMAILFHMWSEEK